MWHSDEFLGNDSSPHFWLIYFHRTHLRFLCVLFYHNHELFSPITMFAFSISHLFSEGKVHPEWQKWLRWRCSSRLWEKLPFVAHLFPRSKIFGQRNMYYMMNIIMLVFFYHPCCVWFLLGMLQIICIWPAVMNRCTTKKWYKNVTSNLKYVVYEQLMCFHCFHPSHATCHENKTKLIKSLQYFQTSLFQTCICSIWHLEEKTSFLWIYCRCGYWNY